MSSLKTFKKHSATTSLCDTNIIFGQKTQSISGRGRVRREVNGWSCGRTGFVISLMPGIMVCTSSAWARSLSTRTLRAGAKIPRWSAFTPTRPPTDQARRDCVTIGTEEDVEPGCFRHSTSTKGDQYAYNGKRWRNIRVRPK